MKDLQKFLNGFNKYKKAMKNLAHKPECLFRISVYQTTEDYVAVIDNDKSKTAKSYSLNSVITQIKGLYPEIKDEEGIKYYPLSQYYLPTILDDYYLQEE